MTDREVLRKLTSIDKSLKSVAKALDRVAREPRPEFLRETPMSYPKIYYGEPGDVTYTEEDCD